MPANIPPHLLDLTLRCLKKQPEDRPQTWQTLYDELVALYETNYGELPLMAYDGPALEARELMDKGYSLTELG